MSLSSSPTHAFVVIVKQEAPVAKEKYISRPAILTNTLYSSPFSWYLGKHENLTLNVSVNNYMYFKKEQKVLEVICFNINSVNQKFDEFKTKIREWKIE